MQIKLLASSSSVEGIERLINLYLCTNVWRVDADTLEVRNSETGEIIPDHLQVTLKRGRFRFERKQE